MFLFLFFFFCYYLEIGSPGEFIVLFANDLVENDLLYPGLVILAIRRLWILLNFGGRPLRRASWNDALYRVHLPTNLRDLPVILWYIHEYIYYIYIPVLYIYYIYIIYILFYFKQTCIFKYLPQYFCFIHPCHKKLPSKKSFFFTCTEVS